MSDNKENSRGRHSRGSRIPASSTGIGGRHSNSRAATTALPHNQRTGNDNQKPKDEQAPAAPQPAQKTKELAKAMISYYDNIIDDYWAKIEDYNNNTSELNRKKRHLKDNIGDPAKVKNIVAAEIIRLGLKSQNKREADKIDDVISYYDRKIGDNDNKVERIKKDIAECNSKSNRWDHILDGIIDLKPDDEREAQAKLVK